MKKASFGLSVLVVSAMALAACAPGTTAGTNNGNTTGSQPLATETLVVPSTGNDTTGLATPEATGTSDQTGLVTPEATATTDTSGTTGGTTGGTTSLNTPEATATTDTSNTTGGTTGGTTSGNTGSTSGSTAVQQGQFVPLSQFLTWGVQSNDNQTVGQVSGVVVSGQGSASTSGSTTGSSASGSTSGTANAAASGPQINYLVIDTRAGNTTGSTNNSGSNTASGNNAYPAGNNGSGASTTGSSDMSAHYVLVPWAAVDTAKMASGAGSDNSGSGMSQSPMVVLNVSSADISGAPAFALNNMPDMSTANWDASVNSFWAGKNITIPNTGSDQSGSSSTASANGKYFVIQAPVEGYTLNGQNNANLGNVTDFLVDLQTGRIAYAVLSGGSLPSGKLYAVPMSGFNWSAGVNSATSSTMNAPTVSSFNSNYTADQLSAAPSASSMSDFSGSGWQSGVNTYWQGLTK